MNRAIWRIIPALALFALIGCSSYDDLGGKARTFEPARTYVSLSPSTTELIHGAGIPPSAIIGYTSSCNYPPLQGEVVVNGTTPSFERILALKPKKVVVEKDLYDQATLDKLTELGLDVVVIETPDLKTFEETIISISKLAGTEFIATKYLDLIYGGISSYEGSVRAGTKVAVIIGNAQSGYMSIGKKSLLADLLTRGKSEVVCPDADKFTQINIEQLVAWNPDVIVTTQDQASGMLADPAMKAVPAVAKGRVLGVNGDVLLREGARVDKLLEALTIGVGRIVDIKGGI